MKLKFSFAEVLLAAVVVTGLAVAAWQFLGGGNAGAATGGTRHTAVELPTLSSAARAGRAAFDANCAKCHGENGSGSTEGPPLINTIYNPGHHPDEAFQRAVRQGVRQHHWPFGDMPPQPQVSDEQLAEIVRFVREVQEANGIKYAPHQM